MAHWIVIYWQNEYALVTLERDNNTFHWMGGFSYCTLDGNENSKIIYDYGEINIDNDEKIDTIILDFLQKFNNPVSRITESGGWISPNGKFYPCNYYEHDKMAKNLAAIYYNTIDGSVKWLELKKWIRIFDDGHVGVDDFGNFVPTQFQIDTMADLILLPSVDKDYKKNLQENMEFFQENSLLAR